MHAKSITYVETETDAFRLTTFDAVTDGVQVARWASRWDAGITFVGVEDSDLLSGKGMKLTKTTSSDDTFVSLNDVPDLADASAIAQFKTINVTEFGIILRGGGADGSEIGYLAYNNAAGVELWRFNGDGSADLLSDTGVGAIENGQVYFMRFDAVDTAGGTTLRFKVWQGALTDEPQEFDFSFDDSISPPIGAGKSGVELFFNGTVAHMGLFHVRSLSGEAVDTWRFAEPTEYLPRDIDAIPSIKGVSYTPAEISLGENLGKRASITVSLRDHPHTFAGESFDQGSFWGKWRARYGTKLRGRPFRLIRGFVGQALDEMDTRHFVIESTDGPTPDGTYTIVAKDILKFADDDRAQAPFMSEGRLAGSIDDSTGSATLTPTGIGDASYPASGHICFGGKEIVAFTRSSDSLTITRGQLGTIAISHTAGDRAQLVLYYDGDDVADIIADLLENYAGVPSEYIPLSEWQAETAAHLAVIYARAITEPTSVNKLISELVEQAALALWWDDRAELIRLQVLKEISTDADVFDEDRILEGSLKVKEQPQKRVSRIWTHFGQRNPTDRGDSEDNYRAALVSVDLEREADYGSAEIRKIKGTWVPTLAAAERLNGIQLSRFRDPPRSFSFDLFRGTPITPAGGYRLIWRKNQDVTGAIVEDGAPIQITRVSFEAGVIRVEAEEMLASGVVVVTNTVILTTTGSLLEWEVPADWNDDDNSIECIGGGGEARIGTGNDGGGGASGGAYSRKDNLALLGSPPVISSPPITIQYRIGKGGGPTGFGGEDGGETWFNGATFAAASVAAKGGKGAGASQTAGAQGGQASEGIGDVKFSGGNGGNGSHRPGGTDHCAGGGGGAAAGPNGDGGDGANASGGGSSAAGGGAGGADDGENGVNASGNTGGRGGNNRFNFGGGVTESPDGQEGGGGRGGDRDGSGGDGGVGQQIWTQTVAPIFSAGPGGGGGGGGSGFYGDGRGGDGGLYGGGSGGGGRNGPSGDGRQGVIVIKWKQAS